ncbi:MAG: hypothetical protein WAS25_13430, partial [Geothrix sp.]
MRTRLGAVLLLVLAACGRSDQSGQVPPPLPTASSPSVGEWTWHPIGGLAVVEGEVSEPTDLVLEGRSIRERRYAEIGPVRWEFFRPPDGETAILRTAEGRELARFTFSLAPRPRPAPAAPRLARKPPPSPPAPAPPTTAPPSTPAPK